MTLERLEKNLIDVLAEQQIKLGYREEKVSLYYPMSSLKNLLGVQGDWEELREALRVFTEYVELRLGKISITHNREERFCIGIPPEGSTYVHRLMEDGEIPGIDFLKEFLDTISRHDLNLQELVKVFQKHAREVVVEELEDGDFQYLIYFKNGEPDAYRYCINFEGCHAIYHRFTAEDYAAFGFQSRKRFG